MNNILKYSKLIKALENAKQKTGLKDPIVSISAFINESEFLQGSIEVNTTSTFHEEPLKGIDISINYKETRITKSK